MSSGATSGSDAGGRRAVRDGLLLGDLDELGTVGLAGSRCKLCREATLGTSKLCPNCGSDDVESIALSPDGVVWTYTIVRYPPPGDFKGPQPFVPFAMGLIELPDGLRVLAPIGGDVEAVKIGMPVRFAPEVRSDGVVQFNYSPSAGAAH